MIFLRRRPMLAGAVLAALALPTWSIGSSGPSPRAQTAAINHFASGLPKRVLKRKIRLFRPPFGAHDEAVDAGMHALNMLQVLWNVDSGDASQTSTPSAEEIAQHLNDRIRPGAIVLMHENLMGAPSITALETVSPAMRARGLIPVTVPELLVLDPPTDEQVSKGSGGCHSAWPRRMA